MQHIRHLNCPNCGEIVQAVCPDIDKIPLKLTASKEPPMFSLASTKNQIACPNCRNIIYLQWYYTETGWGL